MASVLIESALGVDRAEIERYYLARNVYAPRELRVEGPASLIMLRAALDAAEREYGSVMGYMTGALGVTEADIETLRNRYLEA